MYSTPFSCLLLSFGVFWQNDSCSIHKLHSAEGRFNKTRRCVGELVLRIRLANGFYSHVRLPRCVRVKLLRGETVSSLIARLTALDFSLLLASLTSRFVPSQSFEAFKVVATSASSRTFIKLHSFPDQRSLRRRFHQWCLFPHHIIFHRNN